jgi:hypothetical protein
LVSSQQGLVRARLQPCRKLCLTMWALAPQEQLD